MKTYYFPNDSYADQIFGDSEPCCLDLDEVARLAREWDMATEELLEQMHEADDREISSYGVYCECHDEITDIMLSTLWADALTVEDRDAYISDWALSSIWEDPEDAPIPAERIENLGRIWDVVHMDMRDICKAADLTQTALAQKFCIPMRTVSDWCRGLRTPPDYVRLLIALQLKLL